MVEFSVEETREESKEQVKKKKRDTHAASYLNTLRSGSEVWEYLLQCANMFSIISSNL